MSEQNFPEKLQKLMQKVGLTSLRELSRKADVSRWQVQQLRDGKALQMRGENLVKLSHALQLSLQDLLSTFSDLELIPQETVATTAQIASYQVEYERLKTEMERQEEALLQEFQLSCLQIIESWLKQWPKAVYAAQKNPQLSAVKLLPLMRPVEQLIKSWGVEAIAPVGSQVAYDPRWHQLTQGSAKPDELVTVKSPGYCQGDKLLYRSEVTRESV